MGGPNLLPAVPRLINSFCSLFVGAFTAPGFWVQCEAERAEYQNRCMIATGTVP